MEKVSILIPVYNHSKYIAQTIESAVGQTYSDIEVVVVDNCSEDNTWEIILAYAENDQRIRPYRNTTNIGPVRNWKRCIDMATGKYAKILWSDDLISPQFIEKTIPLLRAGKNVGFVFTGTEIFSDKPNKVESVYFIGDTGLYDASCFIENVLVGKGYPVSPGCALFRLEDLRKNLLIEIPNKISSDFAMHGIGNDVLIYLLTASQYRYFGFVNEPLSSFRSHDHSITISSEPQRISFLYALAKAHFVENHIHDKQLIKKFNAVLLSLLIEHRKGKLNLNHLNDFFLHKTDHNIDIIFFAKVIIYRLANYVTTHYPIIIENRH